ncbi:hypothetical protein ACFL5G_01465 [Candidatus Margulisiibacteriota bacterium]
MRPVGARSLGMGAAVVAFAEDGTVGYWNPAVLAYVNRSEVNSMQGTILGDVDYLQLGYNRLRDPRIWDIALGVNILNTRVDGIKEATYQNGAGSLTGKSFSYQGNAYVFSAAKALDKKLAVGLNFKYIQESLYDNGASGTGFDAGLFYRLNSRTQLGLVYQNITPPQLAWDTDSDLIETIPFNIIIGVSHKITRQFLLAVDVNSRSDRGLGLKVGGRFIFNKYLTFRAGYDQERLFLGTSLAYEKFGLHYTFATEPVGEVVDNKHFLSLSYLLEEQEDLIEPLEEEQKIDEAEKPREVSPGELKVASADVEEIPLLEFKKDAAINKMTVKKINGLVKTEVVFENTGEVTTDIKCALSIYDDQKQPLKVFSAKKVSLEPNKTYTAVFDWKLKAELPKGTYFFKARVVYNGSEKSVVKKVIRK